MKIIRQINNNAALALDGNGKELVVLGRGVGFPKMPYELTDLSRIERTFYDVNPKYFGMAADLPRPLVLACAEITERAEIELKQKIADLSFCFEFQVVVAVVGFLWHS